MLTQVQENNFSVPEGVMRSTYISVKTGKTPAKRQLFKDLDEANSTKLDLKSRLIQIRQTYCIGLNVKRLSPEFHSDVKKRTKGKKARGNCVFCRAETRSFCLGCKRYFCDEVRPEWIKDNLPDKELCMAFTEDIYVERTCFNIAHHDARKQFFLGSNPWAPFTGDISSVEEVCKYCQQFPDVIPSTQDK